MKSPQERAAERRAEKLREIDEAVGEGRLVIRPMTPEERKKLPRRPLRATRRH